MDRRERPAGLHDREQDGTPDRTRVLGRPHRLRSLARATLALLAIGAGALMLPAREAGQADEAIRGRIRRQDGAVRSVAYAPIGHTLATVHLDGTVRLSDDRGGTRLLPPEGRAPGESAILCLGFSPDGRTLACGATSDVTLWDVTAEGRRLAHLHHKVPVLSVAFSPDGRALATGCQDGTVRLWDVAPARERAVLRGHRREVRTVSFAPDGLTLASGSDDGTIRLWDVASRAETGRLAGPIGRIISVAFSPDGRTLASGGSYPPDHSGGELILWDVASGRERLRPRGHQAYITSVAFSPDGLTLASGSADQQIKLWDVATGKHRATLAGHEGFVDSVAFSPDGRWIASGGEDTLTGLWDLAAEHLAGGPRASGILPVALASGPAGDAGLDPSDADLMLTYETSVSLSPARRPRSLPDGDRPPGVGGRPKL